jgi:glycosyltransferase involved in cell wall biosynthesis
MDNNIFLSYIIPCYNVEKYLPRCIKSLEKQKIDGFDIEFVFINDGSADDSLRLIREFAARDRRVVVLNQENQGVSAARNNGLTKARGTYVFFLDGDDYLTPEASELLYEVSAASNPDIIISNAFYVNERTGKKTEWKPCPGLKPGSYPTDRFVDLVKALPISFKTYRRDFLMQNDIYYDEDLKVGEVYTFFLHCLAYANTVAFTDKFIMNYLVRSGSVMREYNVKRDSLILNTIKRMDEFSSLFKYDIKNKLAYNNSFYAIVNMFSIKKYYAGPLWNNNVVCFLESVRKNEAYKDVLRYILHNKGFNRRTISLALRCYLPVRVSYRLYRIKRLFTN